MEKEGKSVMSFFPEFCLSSNDIMFRLPHSWECKRKEKCDERELWLAAMAGEHHESPCCWNVTANSVN